MSCKEDGYEKTQSQEVNWGESKGTVSGYNQNRFSALKNLEDTGDINRACDAIRGTIKISAKEIIGRCE
jgi:hypothetical protein